MTKKLLAVFVLFSILIVAGMLFAAGEKGQTQGKTTTQAATSVYKCPMHPDQVSDKPGKCPKCGMMMVKEGQKMAYSCPMHPDVMMDQPGKCPKCNRPLERTMAPDRFQGGNDNK